MQHRTTRHQCNNRAGIGGGDVQDQRLVFRQQGQRLAIAAQPARHGGRAGQLRRIEAVGHGRIKRGQRRVLEGGGVKVFPLAMPVIARDDDRHIGLGGKFGSLM